MIDDRIAEQEFNKQERELADWRWRQYRCENLFWRLWGLPMELAQAISESVWMINTGRFERWFKNNS